MSINSYCDNVIVTVIMHTCQACRKILSRKDSLIRHQRQFCKVIRPRKIIPNRSDTNKNVKNSKMSTSLTRLKLIKVIFDLMYNHQQTWKKEFKKLKSALLSSANLDYKDSGNGEANNYLE